jgi:hypothetical protein
MGSFHCIILEKFITCSSLSHSSASTLVRLKTLPFKESKLHFFRQHTLNGLNYFILTLVIPLCFLNSHKIQFPVRDTCTFILTVPPIVSFWDPRMHYKCRCIGSVLQKAWWWLTVETCCLICNNIINLLCLSGICILYGINYYLFEIYYHYFP